MTYRLRLGNGIRVVGEEIPMLRSVSIGIWVGTGSRHENAYNNGVSHFLEHMFFKGTDRFTARELAEVFDSLGGQVNAFTSKEYTCFYAKVLDEHFDTALDTLSDMLFHSQFAPEEIEKEKKVVIEEIRMYEDTPDELVMDVLTEGVYSGHSLGYTILGLEENLRRFTQTDILQYISSQYQSDNIVIAIAGNISEQAAAVAVERLFGQHNFATGQVAQASSTLTVPVFHLSHDLREKDIEQIHLALAAPGYKAGDERLYAMILLNNALGSSSSSKLFQEIREERGLAYSVYSFHSAYQDCGMFGIYAGTSPEHAQDVLALTRKLCDEVAENGLTDEELRKGKEQVKGSMMLSLESTSSRMSRLGKNELLLSRDVSIDETLRGINAVQPEDIRRVAREVLGQQFALAAVGPVSGLK